MWQAVFFHSVYVLAQPIYLGLRYAFDQEYFRETTPTWFAVMGISWLFIVTQISIPFFTSPLRNLPSPPPRNFFLGHFDTNRGKPPSDNVERLVNDTPNDGLIMLWSPFYLWGEMIATKPETIMEVVNAHNYDWEKPVAAKRLLARTLGQGLVNVEGNTHKAMRKAVAPAFSGKHIRDLVPLFYSKGIDFADAMAREMRESADSCLEMMGQMSRVTLDIIGAAGMGKDFHTIEHDDDPLANLYATITDTRRGPLLPYFLIMTSLPTWLLKRLRGTPYSKVSIAHEQLHEQVRGLMQEKKELMLEKGEQQKDIIAIIMRSGDFSDEYLTSQLLTFLAAGHDTTASALTWTTYLLSLHPDMQNRLRAECTTVLSTVDSTTISPSLFDADQTPYLNAICNETLRFYPTVPVTARHAVRPTRILSTPIPKGSSIVLAPWAINRSRALWGPDADQYNPDRWLHGPNAANGGAISPHALITFLHGPRSCIGQGFARMEMKCILAALIMRFRFELVEPGQRAELGGFITIKPKGGLKLRLVDLKAEQGK